MLDQVGDINMLPERSITGGIVTPGTVSLAFEFESCH
jgi:hypothetical protein